MPEYYPFAKSGLFQQRIRAGVKILKKSREIHDSGGIAIAPLHVNLFSIAQHFSRLPQFREVYCISARSRNPFFLPALTLYTLGMQLLDGSFRSPSGEPLFHETASIIRSLIELTTVHRKTLLVARTWLQHALPTTFGYITAGWLDAFIRHRERLDFLLDDSLALQFGGAAGTLAALGDRGVQVAAFL